MRGTVALLLSVLVAAAQQPRQTEPRVTTFSTTTQLVVETVTVKDKKGNPIEGLTAKDFSVTEDGKPQTIAFVEYQNLPDSAAPELPAISSRGTAVPRLTRTQISAERPGEVRYRDRRLLVLYFDMTAMPAPDQIHALAAAQKFVRTQITSSDLLAIMMYANGAVQILEDFTGDRDRLLSTLQTLIVGEEDDTVPSDSDTGAAFGQNDSEFNLFNTDRQLSALQTAAGMLGRLSEKKSLIYFASGLRLNGVDNQAQLRATINAAVRAGVTFWPIDARGLVAQPPLGDASRGSPGGIGMYTGASAMTVASNFQRSQDTLYALAAIPVGRRCWILTTSLAASFRRRRRAPVTIWSDTTLPISRWTASSAGSKSHSTVTYRRIWITAMAITPASNSASSRPPIRSGSSKRL